MGIQDQLSFFLGIVENRHLAVADDRQFLLFEGMQPAHEDVCLHTASEFAGGQGSVKNILVEIGAALGAHLYGSLIQQGENDGDIVRGEAPQNVLFRAQLPQVQAR